MRHRAIVFLLFLSSFAAGQQSAAPATQTPAAPAQPTAAPAAAAADVDTLDHIIAALYDVISGPQGQARDWNRFKSLFLPEGRLIPNGIRPDGTVTHSVLSPDDYVKRASGA